MRLIKLKRYKLIRKIKTKNKLPEIELIEKIYQIAQGENIGIKIEQDQIKLDSNDAQTGITIKNSVYENSYYYYVIIQNKVGIYNFIYLYITGKSKNLDNSEKSKILNENSKKLKRDLDNRVESGSNFIGLAFMGTSIAKIRSIVLKPNEKKIQEEKRYYDIATNIISQAIMNFESKYGILLERESNDNLDTSRNTVESKSNVPPSPKKQIKKMLKDKNFSGKMVGFAILMIIVFLLINDGKQETTYYYNTNNETSNNFNIDNSLSYTIENLNYIIPNELYDSSKYNYIPMVQDTIRWIDLSTDLFYDVDIFLETNCETEEEYYEALKNFDENPTIGKLEEENINGTIWKKAEISYTTFSDEGEENTIEFRYFVKYKGKLYVATFVIVQEENNHNNYDTTIFRKIRQSLKFK